MRVNMENWERLVSVAAGAGLLAAARRTSGGRGTAALVAGAGLVARGATGFCPVNATLGRE